MLKRLPPCLLGQGANVPPVRPREAVCTAFSGQVEEVPTTGEIDRVRRLWANSQKPAIWGEMVQAVRTGKRPSLDGASIAPGYTPCRTRRGKAPAPPAPEGEKGAKCRERKRRSSQRG